MSTNESRRPAQDQHISVILKVTERCNLACPYCYFFFSGDDSYKQHPALIGDVTVAQVISFIQDAQRHTGLTKIRIGLHGGEPLLLGKRRFDDLCRMLRSALGAEPDLMLAVQTNGMLIDEEWIELFSEHCVRIGVSIDGPPHIHDRTRITKRGAGSYQETAAGWRLLTQAAARGAIPEPGVLCVVSPQDSGSEIFEHFVNELEVRSMNFLLLDETYDSIPFKPGLVDGCAKFLVDIVDAWARASSKRIHVRFIDEIAGPLLNDELYLRRKQGMHPLHQISVSSNGDLCPDDVIRGYSPAFAETNVNVADTNYNKLVGHDAWTTLSVAHERLPEACTSCTWKDICGGGMLQHRYGRRSGFANPSVYCAALKTVYAHVAALLIDSGASAEAIQDRITRFNDNASQAASSEALTSL